MMLFGYCLDWLKSSKQEEETVKLKDFVIEAPIGRGGFGKVYKVKYENEQYAMKEMLKARILMKRSLASVMKELDIMRTIHSDFIVNVHWAFEETDNIYLVMDFMDGGDLRYHLLREIKFRPE